MEKTSCKAPVVRIERRKISRGNRSGGGGGRGVDGMISGKDEGGRGRRSLLNRQKPPPCNSQHLRFDGTNLGLRFALARRELLRLRMIDDERMADANKKLTLF